MARKNQLGGQENQRGGKVGQQSGLEEPSGRPERTSWAARVTARRNCEEASKDQWDVQEGRRGGHQVYGGQEGSAWQLRRKRRPKQRMEWSQGVL